MSSTVAEPSKDATNDARGAICAPFENYAQVEEDQWSLYEAPMFSYAAEFQQNGAGDEYDWSEYLRPTLTMAERLGEGMYTSSSDWNL